jgi:hypothetical protein
VSSDASYLRPRPTDASLRFASLYPTFHHLTIEVVDDLMNQQAIKLDDISIPQEQDDIHSPNVKTARTAGQSGSSYEWRSKKVFFIGILIFLGFSWVLCQTSSAGDKIKHTGIFYGSDSVIGDNKKMGDNRSVGYFVSITSHSDPDPDEITDEDR